MKLNTSKYQANSVLRALKKMCAMILVWMINFGRKDTPVLMASKNYNINFTNAKSLAVAAAMPIVTVPIQDIQLLDFAVAHETVNVQNNLIASTDEDLYMGLLDGDPYTSPQQKQRDKYELNDDDWYSVSFEQVEGTSKCHFALTNDWIKRQGYEAEKVVILNLPEQGIDGPFRVTAIKHIIPQKKPSEDAGDGYNWKPVTGLFEHQSDQVYEISFDNGEELGVTFQHPIYSVTIGDWRLAGELEVGEQVLTKEGEATVASSARKEGSETVYNLEVQELHNFLVGESGIVVHNNYQWILDLLSFPFNQVKKKLKHAPDFGLSDHLNNTNVNAFKKHLEDFVSNSTGKKYLTDVDFKGQHLDAIVVYEEATRLMVVTKGSGEFISAWKMGEAAAEHLLTNKHIW